MKRPNGNTIGVGVLAMAVFAGGCEVSQLPWGDGPAGAQYAPYTGYQTGAVLANFTHSEDAYLQLLISDGNDIYPGRLTLYAYASEMPRPAPSALDGGSADAPLPQSADGYDATTGKMKTFSYSWVPVWESTIYQHYGQLCLGDYDADGDTDFAVAVGFSPTRRIAGGGVMLYRNDSTAGSRTTFTEVWRSWEAPGETGVSTISCAFGDADHDGHLDLALAVYARGFAPPRTFQPPGGVMVYRNEACPAGADCAQGARGFYGTRWSSAQNAKGSDLYAADVGFADFDSNGRLDLFATGSGTWVWFDGEPSSASPSGWSPFASTPQWVANEQFEMSYAAVASAIHVGGAPTLFVTASCNLVLAAPRYGAHRFNPTRAGTGTAVWSARQAPCASRLVVADYDFDGAAEMAMDHWGMATNIGNARLGAPVWYFDSDFVDSPARGERPDATSQVHVSGQAIPSADVDRLSVQKETITIGTAEPGASVLTIRRPGVFLIDKVACGGRTMKFASVPYQAWVSVVGVAESVACTADILIDQAPDVAIATWNPLSPVYLWRNNGIPRPGHQKGN